MALEAELETRVSLLLDEYWHFLEDRPALEAQLDCLVDLHGRATIGDQLRRHARTQPNKVAFISYAADGTREVPSAVERCSCQSLDRQKLASLLLGGVEGDLHQVLEREPCRNAELVGDGQHRADPVGERGRQAVQPREDDDLARLRRLT